MGQNVSQVCVLPVGRLETQYLGLVKIPMYVTRLITEVSFTKYAPGSAFILYTVQTDADPHKGAVWNGSFQLFGRSLSSSGLRSKSLQCLFIPLLPLETIVAW